MSFVSKLLSRASRKPPRGRLVVVDPSPLNWLFVTYNTVEELVRVTHGGLIRPAAMRLYHWRDANTLDITLRADEQFPDGEPVTSATVARAFEEAFRWTAPHPPGMQFNIDPATRIELRGSHAVRLHLPAPDGLAVGKLRAYHVMSASFWGGPGFGYLRNGTGEGKW